MNAVPQEAIDNIREKRQLDAAFPDMEVLFFFALYILTTVVPRVVQGPPLIS